MGLDYAIVYEKGSDNSATDPFSRNSSAKLMETVSIIDTDLPQKIQNSWSQDQHIHNIISTLSQIPQLFPKYTWSHRLLKRKGKLVVGKDDNLRQQIIKLVHDSSYGGHTTVEVTSKKPSS